MPIATDPAVPGTPAALFDPATQRWITADTLPTGTDPLAPDTADTLTGAGLALRDWHPSDAPVLAELLDDDSLWAQMPEPRPHPMDPAAARLLILATALVPGTQTRAVTAGGRVIGQVRLVFSGSEAELSYWLGRAHRGLGLGRALIGAAVRRIFAHRPDLHRLTARVRPTNAPSRATLAGAGFTPLPGRSDAAWLWMQLRGSAAMRRRS